MDEKLDLIGGFIASRGTANHDEQLESEVVEELKGMEEEEFQTFCRDFVYEMYLSDEALEEGYGVGDIRKFVDWLNEHGIYP